jgi:hypothetical protein
VYADLKIVLAFSLHRASASICAKQAARGIRLQLALHFGSNQDDKGREIASSELSGMNCKSRGKNILCNFCRKRSKAESRLESPRSAN